MLGKSKSDSSDISSEMTSGEGGGLWCELDGLAEDDDGLDVDGLAFARGGSSSSASCLHWPAHITYDVCTATQNIAIQNILQKDAKCLT